MDLSLHFALVGKCKHSKFILGSFLKIRRFSDFLENSQIITSLGDLEQAYIIDDYAAQKSSLHIVTTLGILSL